MNSSLTDLSSQGEVDGDERPPLAPLDDDPPMPSHARAITRSTIGSLFATGSEFVTLPVLVHLLGVAPAAAYFAVQFLATLITFLFNRYWAFEAQRGQLGGQGLRYVLVFAGSLGLNTGLSSLLHYSLGLQPVLAFAVSQVLVYLMWNYPLNRYFVFRRIRRAPLPAAAVPVVVEVAGDRSPPLPPSLAKPPAAAMMRESMND